MITDTLPASRSADEQLASRVGQRLAELRREFTAGERRRDELEEQLAVLRHTMLRIGGAIQILEELTATPAASEGDPSAS